MNGGVPRRTTYWVQLLPWALARLFLLLGLRLHRRCRLVVWNHFAGAVSRYKHRRLLLARLHGSGPAFHRLGAGAVHDGPVRLSLHGFRPPLRPGTRRLLPVAKALAHLHLAHVPLRSHLRCVLLRLLLRGAVVALRLAVLVNVGNVVLHLLPAALLGVGGAAEQQEGEERNKRFHGSRFGHMYFGSLARG